MNKELETALAAMTDNRVGLGTVVERLSPDDMAKARPGGWSVGRVLQHVIDSEADYTKLVCFLRGAGIPELVTTLPSDGPHAVRQLARTRTALTESVAGVDDETLYRLVPRGANEYSVLSVLENVSDHDHEHLAQIQRLLGPRA